MQNTLVMYVLVMFSKEIRFLKNGSVTYEGMINKMNLNNGIQNTIWTKYYGDLGGDDSLKIF